MYTLLFWRVCSFFIPTIGDKIVETLYSNRMTWENKRIHTPSLTSWGVLFSIGSSNRGTTLHGGDGGGKLKLYFLLLKSVKRKKAQFWANCLSSFCRRLYILYFFRLEMHLSHLSLLENNRGLWGKNRPCFRVKQESINLGYWIRGHEGERNNFFSKIQLVGQKYRGKTT